MTPTLRNENDTQPRLEYYPVNSPTLRTVVIEEYPFIIGRGDTAQLQIRLESISREHAELTKTSTGYVLRDLNSTNGTAINGQPISAASLEDGDIVSIAETKLTFLCPTNGNLERMVTQPLGDRQKSDPQREIIDPQHECSSEIKASRELAEALLWQAIPLKRTSIIDCQSGSEQSTIVSIDRPLAVRLRATDAQDIYSTASRIQQMAWQLTAENAGEIASSDSILMAVELQSCVDSRLCDALIQASECLTGSQSLGIILPWELAVQSPATLSLCAELKALGADLAFDRFSGGAACIGDMELASPEFLVLEASLARGISSHPRRLTQLKNLISICEAAEIELVLPYGLPEEDCQASHDLGLNLLVSNASNSIEVASANAVVALV
ncbi:FHA domain-containing protein [Bythopirellula polymerisocia]|uniref:FHA domain-containing protein FhaA n=1 Tax=Bythopirellula polymerisocia TaxID=2528003 RepID=A0A5C6CAY1_9BACT|nr:FHA domain-containing protein [Bythopirellula polymerisocia]TWU21903.1 FHA domain-containing protein FhaA [Bythopirellula polymerisocia]